MDEKTKGRGPKKLQAIRSPEERNALAEQWYPYAIKIARWFWKHKAGKRIGSLEDCEQIAIMGLLRAAELYDESKGFKFSTYCTAWIKQHIYRAADDGGMIRVPAHILKQIRGAKSLYNAPPESIEAAKRARSTGFLPVFDDGETFEPADHRKKRDPLDEKIREAVSYALTFLHPKHRMIIGYRYGFLTGKRLTLEKTAEIMNLTRERVRQLEDKALYTLYKRLKHIKGRFKNVG